MPVTLALSDLLSTVDVCIIVGFLLSVIAIGAVAAFRSSKSAADFFLSGRSMPWWLLGVSMVACTFSCDTPNLVTDIVRQQGVAGNWQWWAYLLTGMLTVFVYAKLWRRSALNTDLGFYEIRYAGRPASFLRGFRAVYLGLFFNVIITGTVSLAAIKIGAVIFGLSPVATLGIALAAVCVYATLGGLTGSIWADFYQYTVAMVGAVAAAYFAIDMVGEGGAGGTLADLFSRPEVQAKMTLIPTPSTTGGLSTMMTIFILPIAVQWWATWYPGAEPGGGGYIAQRMLSAKDEKNAVGATLLFNFLHYALRSWPWLLVALASIVLFPLSSEQDQKAAKDWLKDEKNQAFVKLYDKANPADKEDAKKWLMESSELDAMCQILGKDKAGADLTRKQIAEKAAERMMEVDRKKIVAEGLVGLEQNSFKDKEGRDIVDAAQKKKFRQYLKQDIAYPAMIAKLPVGWLGIVVASLVAAYMSTIATQVNWGSSYLVQDFYARFVRKDASPKEQVLAGRICMVLLMAATFGMALILENAKGGFDLMLQIGAGTGLLYVLRWFWWRINAWSEISAMVISFAVACFFQWAAPEIGLTGWLESGWRAEIFDLSAWKLLIGVLVTTVGWMAVTFCTKPEKREVLEEFCTKIRAGGPGWKAVVGNMPAAQAAKTGWDVPTGILCMLVGCLAIWSCLFGVGYLIYGCGNVENAFLRGGVLMAVSVVSTVLLLKLASKVKLS